VLFSTYYLGDTIEDEMGGACTHMGKVKCKIILVRNFEGERSIEIKCRCYDLYWS